jgi:Ser/Thr protein kinase RdoA (MazF antagonist)
MIPMLDFVNANYPGGPYAIGPTYSTTSQRQAHRLDGPGGSFVCKLTDPGRPEAVVRADVHTPDFLARQGFPAPKPVPARTGDLYLPYGERFLYLYAYIPGSHPRASDDFYRKLGVLLGRLHSMDPCGEVPDSDLTPEHWLVSIRASLLAADSFVGEPGGLSPDEQRAIAPALLEAIERFPSFDGLPHGILHSDACFTNLVETPSGELYLIDWEDAGIAYPLVDLGLVLSYLVTFTAQDQIEWGVVEPQGDLIFRPDWGRAFLEAYESVRPLSAAERRLLPAAIRLGFAAYIPNWGTTQIILDNYRRMKMVEAGMDEMLSALAPDTGKG